MRVRLWAAWFCVFGVAAFATSAHGEENRALDLREQSTKEVREYLRLRVAELTAREPAVVGSFDEWNAQRGRLRDELFDMLGLAPLPARGDLQPTVTGSVERDRVVVEKLHFQSLPGLYVTANFYRPKDAAGPLPTILYLCGHGREVADGRSVGNKVHYQHHGAWFAQNGYCCLMVDTLQLGEIEGQHHGTYRLGRWWWINRGYTPAGVEAWNSIRALDYLQTRPEVDMQKIGVTGRSGGGAYTWWIAALDDRPAAIVPVAGITDLEDHVVHDCVQGHCDCMYMVNERGWDFATVAALAAPRPCLLANTDKDGIFPLGGVTRIHDKLRAVYALHGAADRLGLFISEGPHADTQELQLASFRWLNRWLRESTGPVTIEAVKLFTPQELRVFESLPADEINTRLDETFVPTAAAGDPPASREAWDAQRLELLAGLKRRCFAGWPDEMPAVEEVPVLATTAGDLSLTIVRLGSARCPTATMFVVAGAHAPVQDRVTIQVVDDQAWPAWSRALTSEFPDIADRFPAVEGKETGAKVELAVPPGEALVLVAPRGWGPGAWADDSKSKTHIPRRFTLVGTTVDAERIWEVRQAIRAAATAVGEEVPIELAGAGDAAAIALYAAIFEDRVTALDLRDLKPSHREGPYLIGVDRVLTMPQALALALDRPVKLRSEMPDAWTWSTAVAKLYGENALSIEPTK